MPTTIWSHPCTGSLFNFGTLGGDPIIKIKWGDCLQHFQSEVKYLPCIHLKWQSPSLSIANEDVLRSLNIQLEWNIFLYLAKTPCHRGPNVGYLDFKKFRVKPNTITTITMMHCFFQTSSVCLWIQLRIISGHFCRKILQKSQICTLRCCLRGGLGPTEVPPLPAAPPPPSSTKLRLLHTPHWHWPTFF